MLWIVLPCVVNGFTLCCKWFYLVFWMVYLVLWMGLACVVNGFFLLLWMGLPCVVYWFTLCCEWVKFVTLAAFLVNIDLVGVFLLLNTDQVLYYWFLINFVLRFFITFKDITLLGFLLTQESVMSLSLPDFNGILVLELLYQNSQLFEGFCFWYICQSKSNLYVL